MLSISPVKMTSPSVSKFQLKFLSPELLDVFNDAHCDHLHSHSAAEDHVTHSKAHKQQAIMRLCHIFKAL